MIKFLRFFLSKYSKLQKDIKEDRLTTWVKLTRMFYTSLYREIQAPTIAHD
jgi:hypothetical protein